MIKCRLDVFKSKDRRNDFREEIEIFLPKEPIRERLLLLLRKAWVKRGHWSALISILSQSAVFAQVSQKKTSAAKRGREKDDSPVTNRDHGSSCVI